MNPRPSNMGASVFEYVRREAKARKRDVQAEAQSYAIRTLIARLMEVDTEGRVLVKGGQSYGLLFGNDRRPTKDLDLSINGFGLDDRGAWIRHLIQVACMDTEDGVTFDAVDIQIENRIHQGSGGYRMTVRSSIHTCRTDFVIDVGVTDTPKFTPIEVDLGDRHPHARSSPKIRVYPMEASFAEKLLSKIEDGASSVRHKDFYDLWWTHKVAARIGDLGYLTAATFDLSDDILARRNEVQRGMRAGDFLSLPEVEITEDCLDYFAFALHRCSVMRGTPIPEDVMALLRAEFSDDGHQAGQYANWIKNQRSRLISLPAGSNEKSAALGLLLDEIGPFVTCIAERARMLAATYDDAPDTGGAGIAP